MVWHTVSIVFVQRNTGYPLVLKVFKMAKQQNFMGMNLNACLALNISTYNQRVGGLIAKVLYYIDTQ